MRFQNNGFIGDIVFITGFTGTKNKEKRNILLVQVIETGVKFEFSLVERLTNFGKYNITVMKNTTFTLYHPNES